MYYGFTLVNVVADMQQMSTQYVTSHPVHIENHRKLIRYIIGLTLHMIV